MTPPRTRKERIEAYALADALFRKGAHTSEITFATGLSLLQLQRRHALLSKTQSADSEKLLTPRPSLRAVRPPIEDSREEALALVAAGNQDNDVAKSLGVPLYQLRAWVAQANTQP